jgi:hypothetical protein
MPYSELAALTIFGRHKGNKKMNNSEIQERRDQLTKQLYETIDKADDATRKGSDALVSGDQKLADKMFAKTDAYALSAERFRIAIDTCNDKIEALEIADNKRIRDEQIEVANKIAKERYALAIEADKMFGMIELSLSGYYGLADSYCRHLREAGEPVPSHHDVEIGAGISYALSKHAPTLAKAVGLFIENKSQQKGLAEYSQRWVR